MLNKKYLIFILLFILISYLPLSLSAEVAKCKIIQKEFITNKVFQKGLKSIEQLKCRILTGKYKGNIAVVNNYIWDNEQNVYNLNLNKDDSVIADIFDESDGKTGYTVFYSRKGKLILVLVMFCIIIGLIIGKKGLLSLLSLFLLFVFIVFIFIPLLKKGYPPLLLSIAFSLFASSVTFVLVLKNRVKIFSSIISTFLGIIIIFLLSILSFYIIKFTGFNTTEGRALIMLSDKLKYFNLYSLKGLFISGIIITGLGAMMDITAGVSSSVYEIHINNKNLSLKQLFFHGLSVGKDVVGTMVNTLIFVTVVQFLIYFICFQIMKTPFIRFSNFDFFVLILLFGLISSISLILIVPITVYTSASFLKIKNSKRWRLFFVIIVFLSSLFISDLLFSWVQPPDNEFSLHPITKLYKHRMRDEYSIGKITNIIKYKERSEDIEIKILTGTYKGNIVKTRIGRIQYDYIKKHTKVIVWIKKIKDQLRKVYIVDKYKFFIIYYLGLLFIFFLLALNRWQGVKIVLSLIVSVFIILFLYTQMIINGFSVILSTGLSGFLILFIILLAVSKNRNIFKIGLISSLCGFIITFCLGILIGKFLKVNGFSKESFQLLNYFNANYNNNSIVNVQNIVYSVIVFGAIGALIDVVITISSTLNEIKLVNPSVSQKELYKNGMEVGKDLSGTMINTLILAYTGFNLGNILLWSIISRSSIQFLNFEFISFEITKAVAGSLGFILIIPVTSFVSSYILCPNKKNVKASL